MQEKKGLREGEILSAFWNSYNEAELLYVYSKKELYVVVYQLLYVKPSI